MHNKIPFAGFAVLAFLEWAAGAPAEGPARRASHLEIQTNAVQVAYSVQFAAGAALRDIDANGNGLREENELVAYGERKAADLAANLALTVDGAACVWVVEERGMEFPVGADGRTQAVFSVRARAPLPRGVTETPMAARFRDANYEGLPGAGEIAVEAGQGVALVTSSVPAALSQDMGASGQAPADVREAAFQFKYWGPD